MPRAPPVMIATLSSRSPMTSGRYDNTVAAYANSMDRRAGGARRHGGLRRAFGGFHHDAPIDHTRLAGAVRPHARRPRDLDRQAAQPERRRGPRDVVWRHHRVP